MISVHGRTVSRPCGPSLRPTLEHNRPRGFPPKQRSRGNMKMRKMGAILLLGGILGAFYCSSQLQKVEPLPEDVLTMDAMNYAAGRWEFARYACFGVAGIGFLLAMFP